MGFFSWNCKHCGKEILAPYPYSKWSEVVAILENDSVIHGSYDGYGGISSVDLLSIGLDDPEMYHAHCWEEAGKPQVFTERSNFAPCQGYFIGPNDLNKDYPIDGGWKFIKDCLNCNGLGYIEDDESENECCPICNGKGVVPDE